MRETHSAGDHYDVTPSQKQGRARSARRSTINLSNSDQLIHTDVCIVGSGPAGILLALEIGKLGFQVIVLESGNGRFSLRTQQLSDTTILHSSHHAPMREATCRRLGGTSAIWGGRCVPFDPIDFERGKYLPIPGWPISYDELAGYYAKACAYSLCGSADFSALSALSNPQDGIVPGLPDDEVLSTSLERWSLPTRFWDTYKNRIRHAKNISILTNATCTQIGFARSKSQVSSLTVRSLKGKRRNVKAKIYVLACGGLESTRLMLNSDGVHAGGVGNHSGKLGRYYMGHISGKIARVRFSTPAEKTIYGFEKDREGVYCRRRFTLSERAQKEQGLLNFAAWLDNPPIHDPAHGNGILSMAYLALSMPFLRRYLAPEAVVKAATHGENAGTGNWRHIKNVASDIQAVCSFVPSFLYGRYFTRRKIPGFFLYDKNNDYALHYHAEHAPDYKSRVFLSNERDELGIRRLVVDMQYNPATVDSVLRCHGLLDQHLRKYQRGKLVYMYDDLASEVVRQASDGFHQIGTTRMSALPEDGVVDPNCRVHGITNLFVSSSSVFPTSGQANPTLTIMALSIRLAEHLKTVLRQ